MSEYLIYWVPELESPVTCATWTEVCSFLKKLDSCKEKSVFTITSNSQKQCTVQY